MENPIAAKTESYDVIIIGGGPAGAIISTFLQRQTHRCLVFESSTFPRYHIGDSLIPHTYGTLDRLGLLPKLRAFHFAKKYSVRFVSRSETCTVCFASTAKNVLHTYYVNAIFLSLLPFGILGFISIWSIRKKRRHLVKAFT